MRSGGDGPDRYPVDAEEDLIDRYESMVQTQVKTLSDIDDKAAKTLRIISVILGVLFTAVSVSIRYFQNSSESITNLQIVLFGAGFLFLLSSMGYASITYLSSVFKYGPTEELGSIMSKYEVGPQDYRNNLLDAYSNIIQTNRKVVRNNARRFRRTMLFLLIGLFFLFAGGVSVALRLTAGVNVLLIFFTSLGSLALTHYIEEEEYLTLEWQVDGDD
jgi:hypothetical protein